MSIVAVDDALTLQGHLPSVVASPGTVVVRDSDGNIEGTIIIAPTSLTSGAINSNANLDLMYTEGLGKLSVSSSVTGMAVNSKAWEGWFEAKGTRVAGTLNIYLRMTDASGHNDGAYMLSIVNSTVDVGGWQLLISESKVKSEGFVLLKGAWNASTNSPSLADGVGTNGDSYRVGTAGTQNLGSGSVAYRVGDTLTYNGSIWCLNRGSDPVLVSADIPTTLDSARTFTGDLTLAPSGYSNWTGYGHPVYAAYTDNSETSFALESHAATSRVVLARAQGSHSSKSALVNGNVVGALSIEGWDGSAPIVAAEIAGQVTENWSHASQTTMDLLLKVSRHGDPGNLTTAVNVSGFNSTVYVQTFNFQVSDGHAYFSHDVDVTGTLKAPTIATSGSDELSISAGGELSLSAGTQVHVNNDLNVDGNSEFGSQVIFDASIIMTGGGNLQIRDVGGSNLLILDGTSNTYNEITSNFVGYDADSFVSVFEGTQQMFQIQQYGSEPNFFIGRINGGHAAKTHILLDESLGKIGWAGYVGSHIGYTATAYIEAVAAASFGDDVSGDPANGDIGTNLKFWIQQRGGGDFVNPFALFASNDSGISAPETNADRDAALYDCDLNVQGHIFATGPFYAASGYELADKHFAGLHKFVTFVGNSANNLAGTYGRSGTLVTVTATAHGYQSGNRVSIDFTSGGALDGVYAVTVLTANTFTVNTAASGTIAPGATLNILRRAIIGSKDIASVEYVSTGLYIVNFGLGGAASNFLDATYTAIVTPQGSGTTSYVPGGYHSQAPNQFYYYISITDLSGTVQDVDLVNASFSANFV